MRFLFCVFSQEKAVFIVPDVHVITITTINGYVPVNVFTQFFLVRQYVVGLNNIACNGAFYIYHWHSEQVVVEFSGIEIYRKSMFIGQ
jgi:hypothetical protein